MASLQASNASAAASQKPLPRLVRASALPFLRQLGRRLSSSPHQQYEDELRQNECTNAAFLPGIKQAVSRAQPTPTSIQIVCGHSCQR